MGLKHSRWPKTTHRPEIRSPPPRARTASSLRRADSFTIDLLVEPWGAPDTAAFPIFGAHRVATGPRDLPCATFDGSSSTAASNLP